MVLLTPGKVERAQGYDLEPLRLDMQAYVKPAMWVTVETVQPDVQ